MVSVENKNVIISASAIIIASAWVKLFHDYVQEEYKLTPYKSQLIYSIGITIAIGGILYKMYE